VTVRRERPGLSREQIIRAALGIIDRDGVAGLSMRKLGARLGVDPMAVYYHLPNKSALFDGVVEAVYLEADFDELPDRGDWRAQSTVFLHRLRETLLRHPNALPIISTRPAYVAPMMRFAERILTVFDAAGFTGAEAIDMVNCLATFTIGHALAQVGEPVGGDTADAEEVVAMIAGGEYPHLRKVFEDGYAYRLDAQYELGLRAMLDGFEAVRQARAR
jgi:TetR/AcrR family tetracycline transcriptional repressor